ncbi:cell division protein FtsX [Aureibacter tunicatorum]|uniref:Cell division protein FtsX n=1 Tax=Aureibacter tunicatorum TaxID=866807 RepID=A0AAE3XNP9_9BACT|nr:permease-like cell division protein FtsX [Aureibacter tunicatorum]MDR6239855.1 cell division transport system permease protein [Aureibacter tunicatorum]BDD04330.1 hypothetical protein AUTU_18130 [Aureibacter tunicatorum]
MSFNRFNKSKTFGTFPFFSVVFSITLALFILGLFGVLYISTDKLTQIIRKNIEVQVYLKKNITDAQKVSLQQKLQKSEFLAHSEDDDAVTFISKESAAEKLIRETGEEFVKFIGVNPLRDVFILKINNKFHSNEQLELIQSDLSMIEGVYEVEYIKSFIDIINHNLTKVSIILVGTSLLLIITIIVLIHNTIKLALFSQRFLIRSMQLTGATDGFISKPFLKRSFYYGIGGGMLSILIIYILTSYLKRYIPELDRLINDDQLYILFGLLLTMGILISLTSTFSAIKKYLYVKLDDLY